MQNDRENIERLSRKIDKVLNHVRNCLYEKGENPPYYQAFHDYLYKSLAVVDASTRVLRADQFIVGVDKDNARFIVFSDTNPDGYKLFAYPFEDAIHNMNTIDGENNTTRVRARPVPYVLRHVARLRDYIEYDLPRYYDNNHNEIQTHNNDGIATQIELISSLSPSEYLTATCIQSWKDKYIQLQEDALQACNGVNKEVDPFIAYLDSVEDRAAEQNHVVRDAQQNFNNNKKENGNEHD